MIMGHLIILQLGLNQSLTSHHYRCIHINTLNGISRALTPSKLSHLRSLMSPLCVCERDRDRKCRSEERVAGGRRGHHTGQSRHMAKCTSPRFPVKIHFIL